MTTRPEQIASTIRQAIQAVLSRGVNDPRVRGLVSVTQVRIAPDLSEAQVFVSVLPAEHGDLTLHGLRSAARHIRHELSERVRLRTVPRLRFVLDHSLKNQAAVERAIRDAGDEAASQPQPQGDGSP